MVALAIAGSTVATVGSSLIGAGAAKSAGAQESAADLKAQQLQAAQQQQTRQDLLPYNTAGQAALPALAGFSQSSMDALNTAYGNVQAAIPQGFSGPQGEANLMATPGYQFNLSQGLKATQNSAAARGLGVSGAAMKGAGVYATGLADSTYQNQFANQQTQFSDANQQFGNKLQQQQLGFNQLYPLATLGENAAAQTGQQGTTSAANQGNSLQASGQALGTGTATAGKDDASALSSIGNSGLNYLGIQNALAKPSGANGPGTTGAYVAPQNQTGGL